MEAGHRPNRRLRLQRRLHGWSQEDVAANLHRLAANLGEPEPGVDATMISRWERGTRRPRPRYVRLLCRLFDLPADQLGIVEDEDELGPRAPERMHDALEDDLERRDFIRRMATLLGVAPAPGPALDPMGSEPWERLARSLHRPGRITAETVNHLEGITVALQSLGPAQVSSRAVLGPVTGHLDAMRLLLQSPLKADLRQKLCSLVGETAGFAGWLRWNMNDHAGAANHFEIALDAAAEAGDRALVAYLAGSAACQPPHRETPQRRLDQLRAIVWADATPAAQVWLAAKEADAHALLGDADSCLRALDRAEAALAAPRRPGLDERPRFTMIDPTWLEGERGASLARLGRTAEAQGILDRVLARLGPERERDRLWLGIALASTHAQDGEAAEAVRVAGDVLQRARELQIEAVVREVEVLLQQLRARGPSTEVADLEERLHAPRGLGAVS
jgi:transcriptional regulator with XRE-family HTH domain